MCMYMYIYILYLILYKCTYLKCPLRRKLIPWQLDSGGQHRPSRRCVFLGLGAGPDFRGPWAINGKGASAHDVVKELPVCPKPQSVDTQILDAKILQDDS